MQSQLGSFLQMREETTIGQTQLKYFSDVDCRSDWIIILEHNHVLRKQFSICKHCECIISFQKHLICVSNVFSLSSRTAESLADAINNLDTCEKQLSLQSLH